MAGLEPIRLLSKQTHGLLRSDRCYMLLHTYPHDLTGRKVHALYFWLGKHAERLFFMVWRFQLTEQMATKVRTHPSPRRMPPIGPHTIGVREPH